MIPKLFDWRQWNALERIVYIVQVASALALIPTVVFAWLGWREAHLARIDQVRLFIAEKAPDVEFTSVRILDSELSGGTVSLYFRNSGNATAQRVSIQLYRDGETLPFKDTDDTIWRDILWIAKGHELSVPVIRVEDMAKEVGFDFDEIRLHRWEDNVEPAEEAHVMLVVNFQGPFGDSHRWMKYLTVSRQ